MNRLKNSIIGFIVAVCIGISITQNVYGRNDYGIILCQAVASDAKSRFRKTLSGNDLRVRDVLQIKCNGMNFIEFAIHQKSANVFKYLINKTKKSSLHKYKELVELSNDEIKALYSERVN